MDIFHQEMLKALTEQANVAFLSLVEQKLADKGVTLSLRQRASLMRKIRARDLSGFSLHTGRGQVKKTINIDITDADFECFSAPFGSGAMPEMINSLTDKLAVNVGKDLGKTWKKEDRRREREIEGFRMRIQLRWGEPLSKLRQLIVMLMELGASVNARLRKSQAIVSPYSLEVQTRLHSRACQTADEVVVLLSSGFAEGAMARWRSLHEVAVVGMFIGVDENLAERYRLHEVVESQRIARLNDQHAHRLGIENVPPEDLQALQAEVKSLTERFGLSYKEQYGWAADALGVSRPTFEQIEARAELGHLRPYYKLASHTVHANPKGAFFRLGVIDQAASLLAGPSNYGLAEAGQNTAISLTQSSAAMTQLDSTVDSIVILKVAAALCDEIGKSFVRVQRELENEEGIKNSDTSASL